MSTALILITVFFALSFIISSVCLRVAFNAPSLKDGFVLVWIVMFGGCLIGYNLNPIHYDSLTGYSLDELFIVFGSALAVYIAPEYFSLKKYSFVLIVLASIGCTFTLPETFLLFEGLLPYALDRAAIVAIWFAISFGFQYLNGSNAIAGMQAIMICSGVLALYFVTIAPFILGLYSAVMIGCLFALLAFNWFPTYISLSNSLCQAVGFICAWLLLKLSCEGASSSALILITWFVVEILTAVVITLVPGNTKTISENTGYYTAIITGLAPKTTVLTIGKVLLLMAILACFQIYSGNFYSIPLLGLVVCLLFAYRLKNWDEKPQTLKEINTEFVADVKEGIKGIKESLGSKKEDK